VTTWFCKAFPTRLLVIIYTGCSADGFGYRRLATGILLREGLIRWPANHLAERIKPRTMTRAVPRVFRAIPVNDAA